MFEVVNSVEDKRPEYGSIKVFFDGGVVPDAVSEGNSIVSAPQGPPLGYVSTVGFWLELVKTAIMFGSVVAVVGGAPMKVRLGLMFVVLTLEAVNVVVQAET